MSSRPNPKASLRRTASRADVVTAARTVSRALARPVRPRHQSNKRMAAQAANYRDTAFVSYGANTTGSIACLNLVPQGVTTTTRVGKKIQMKSLQCHGLMQSDSTTTVTQASYLIVYDRRPSGALPAITDILDTVSPNSFLNDANSSRFKILKREDFVCLGNTATAGAITDAGGYEIDWYYKFPPKYAHCSFKALGTGAIDDIDEGAIYLVAVGSSVAGTADATFGAGFRLRFYDQTG